MTRPPSKLEPEPPWVVPPWNPDPGQATEYIGQAATGPATARAASGQTAEHIGQAATSPTALYTAAHQAASTSAKPPPTHRFAYCLPSGHRAHRPSRHRPPLRVLPPIRPPIN
ncbi:MAG: hypothetical protein R3F40_15475 [Candidatus Competibacteraceae bacterium]